jgi:hypothetical protein
VKGLDEMSGYDLDRLEKLEKAATPGEWHLQKGERETHFDKTEEYYVSPAWIKEIGKIDMDEYVGMNDDDAALIVALRNAAPEMLADLRRLRDCIADMGDMLSDHIYGDKATMAELHRIYRRALAEESE